MSNNGKSILPLTGSCEVSVRGPGRAGRLVVLEVTQRRAEVDRVTTLLLSRERARELAAALLAHARRCGTTTGD